MGYKFIDLFAGIGGMHQAFSELKAECVYGCEWDEYARRTYLHNFKDLPEAKLARDINDIDIDTIPAYDILVAGFPCQPFSIAGVSKKNSLGRAHGFDDLTQGNLFFKLAEILERTKPRAFLLENVKNLRSHDGRRTYAIIEGRLKALGYKIAYSKVLDGRAFVPQHRERIFIVGFLEDHDFNLPDPRKGRRTMASVLERRPVDPKYTLSDKLWAYLQAYAKKHKAKGNGFGYGKVTRRSVARTLSARYYKDGSEILVDQPGRNPRRLTPKECARLMGFPKRFEIPETVSDTRAYKQFGNSVVVPLVKYVARELLKTLRRQDRGKVRAQAQCELELGRTGT